MTPVTISAPSGAGMDLAYSSAASLSSLFGLGFLVATFVVMLGVIFFGGLMFYYFAGQKPGKHIVHSMMNFLTRGYTQFWMFVSILTTLIGVTHLVKGILGFLYPIFTYGVKNARAASEADLKTGLIIFGLGVLVFGVHYYLNSVIESTRQKQGTVLSKGFVALGLFVTSSVLVISLYTFVFNLISFTSNSIYSTTPGASLATIAATLPFWIYYVARATYMMRYEK